MEGGFVYAKASELIKIMKALIDLQNIAKELSKNYYNYL